MMSGFSEETETLSAVSVGAALILSIEAPTGFRRPFRSRLPGPGPFTTIGWELRVNSQKIYEAAFSALDQSKFGNRSFVVPGWPSEVTGLGLKDLSQGFESFPCTSISFTAFWGQ